MIDVLHVFDRMNRGGAETRTVELMRVLGPRGIRFHFGALSGLSGPLDSDIAAHGGFVHPIRLGPAFPARLWDLHRRFRFRVVHSHVHHVSGLMVALAAGLGVPVRIVHFRSTSDGKPLTARRRLRNVALRTAADLCATHILAVSEGAMQAAWGPDWTRDPRCRVVYNGIDAAPYPPEDRGAVRAAVGVSREGTLFIHVGRMAPPKNHERLIRIFSRIAVRDPAASLLLVGRGDNDIERRVRAAVADLGLATRVIFAGERDDVPRLLAAADLLLLPSLWEGLPGVVLEACAAGTPVLASDLPATAEIAAHFPSVRLCSLDTPDDEWARLALDIARGPRDADTLARLRESPFAIERSAAVIEDIYRAGSRP